MRRFNAFVFLLAMAAGCVTHVEPFGAPQPEPPPKPVPAPAGTQAVTDNRVIIDPALAHTIRLVKIASSTSRDGYLKVQLNIQNMTGSYKQFRYRVDWIGEDGLSLPMAESVPMEWTLLKQETSFLALTSPTPAARSFRVVFAPN